MRRVFLFCAMLVASALVLLGTARAAEGKQARFSISVSFGDEFYKLMRQQFKKSPGPDSAQQDQLDQFAAGNLAIPTITGVLYYQGQRLRMDMNLPGGQVGTMIVDQSENRFYLIDHSKRKAQVMDLAEFGGSQLSSGGMLVNPELASMGWDDFVASMKAQPGVSMKDLGSQKISGVSCRGVRMSGTLGALTDAEELDTMPGVSTLIDPKMKWEGTAWLTDGLPVPVKFNSSMMGVDTTWQILELSDWNGSEAFLKVPPGYSQSSFSLKELEAMKQAEE